MMAVSGAIFVLYVLLHMYGNLKLFSGQESFDAYAESLRTLLMPILPHGGLLWVLRVVLIVAVIAHVYAAFALWARANNARPSRYVASRAAKAALRTQMMRWGGVALLAFIIFHLIHFTIVKVNFNSAVTEIDNSPYRLAVAAFELWWLVLIYLIALVALGLHLYHGVYSAIQTMGWTQTANSRSTAKTLGVVIALVTSIGFALPPLAILFGLI